MNPSDALSQDYGMYYDNCWMRHTTHGIGRVRVVGGDMYLERQPGADPIQVQPKYLECWWPRPGAFNCGDHAVYIARRAIRNMRKSATSGDHYFVKWGSPYGKEVMMCLKTGPNTETMDSAIDLIQKGRMSSVAVTRDIIIEPNDRKGEFNVIFRGMEAGTYTQDGGFIPLFSNNPWTHRILRQLEDTI